MHLSKSLFYIFIACYAILNSIFIFGSIGIDVENCIIPLQTFMLITGITGTVIVILMVLLRRFTDGDNQGSNKWVITVNVLQIIQFCFCCYVMFLWILPFGGFDDECVSSALIYLFSISDIIFILVSIFVTRCDFYD